MNFSGRSFIPLDQLVHEMLELSTRASMRKVNFSAFPRRYLYVGTALVPDRKCKKAQHKLFPFCFLIQHIRDCNSGGDVALNYCSLIDCLFALAVT